MSTRRSGKEKTKIPEVETAGPSKSRKIRPVSSPSEKSKPRRVASLSEKSKTKRAATPLPLIEQPNEENPEAIVAAPPAAPPVAPSLVSLAKTSTKRVASSLPPIGHSGTGNDPLTTGPPRTDKGTGKGKRAASVLPSIEQPETKKLERTSAVPPRSNSSPLSPAPSCPEDITIAEAAKLGLPTNHAAEKDNVSSAPKKPADNDKWNVSPTTGPTTGPTTSPTTRVSGSNKSKAAEIPLDDTPADHVQLAKEKRLPDITDFEYTDRPDFSQEKTFNQRPAVRINVPDHIKSILVDDWENVTKNLSLVPLPAEHPVNEIMSIYFEEEKGKRRLGSAEADLLEEVVAGVKEYFETCVGRILLYRFEREQYFEVRKLWVEGKGEWEGKNAGDVYGAEHLCRLFGKSFLLFPSHYHSSPSAYSPGPAA